MNRITATLAELKQQNEKAVVSYIVSGDPYPEATLPTMHALVAKGADIIELGVPFSDPMAEGPVIQRGHERALAYNVSLKNCLEIVAQFRKTNNTTPVILMGYANPVERFGYKKFSEQASKSGVDGVLIVDLPPEESKEFNAQLIERDMKMIFLVAPTTSHARIKEIVSLASGFIYYVSLKGVTGAGHIDVEGVRAKMAIMREMTDTPICVGFGIKDAESAKAIAQFSDGVVVGSALVSSMGSMVNAEASIIANVVSDLIRDICLGVDELKTASKP